MGKKFKFDVAIGNPPYQETSENTSDSPIYNEFMDAVMNVADKVELITPARFLFNAGKTSKAWNKKMLNDPHFKVLYYNPDPKGVFPNTEIKGGVAVTYRDVEDNHEPIKVFTKFSELNDILHLLLNKKIKSLNEIIYLQNKFDLDVLYEFHPECKAQIGSNGKERRLTSSIFTTVDIFSGEKGKDSVKILGIEKNKRVYKYIPSKFLAEHANLNKYKVIISKVNSSGSFGEKLVDPIIIGPNEGFTQSFLSIGAFDDKKDAESALKYIKSKFVRACLGILKITQDNPPEKWEYVPLQDFTSHSDIDWSKSVHEIDLQLYKKYGLDEKEIDFIEMHVKEMD